MSAAEARNPTRSSVPSKPTPGGRGNGRPSAAQRYDVLERLGEEGTLWVVYRAREKATGELRALKALKSAFARHAAFSSALEAAARPTLAWDHPNLARLHEAGYEDGTLFLTEEWLPGISLETRLKRAPLVPTETIQISRQLASALEYLAGRGEAHGDLRPRQILCGDVAGARNANAQFSCARWAATDGGLSGAFAAANLSLPDVQSDAVYYLAPERFEGAPPSPQSDIYALGVVLYRMLTGRVPFDGPAPLSIARRHKSDAPMRPGQWNRRVSPELESLAMALLVKNPGTRPSAEEVVRALRPADDTLGGAGAAVMPVDLEPESAGAVKAVEVADAEPPSAPVIATPTINAPVAQVPVADDAIDEAPGAFDAQADALTEKRERKRHRRREAVGAFLALFWTLVSAGVLAGILFGAYDMWQKTAPREVKVPAYVGKSQTDADKLLQSYGLVMTVRSTRYDPSKPEGTVLSGDQPPGKAVKQGREVLVTLSQGPQPMRMVDFHELSLQRARQIIARQSLTIGNVAERYDETIPRGYICDQFPNVGEMVRPTQPVSLVVSKGPQPTSETPAPDAPPVTSPDDSQTLPDATDDDSNDTNFQDTPDVTLVSRSIRLRVLVPSTGGSRRVRIVVRDENGEQTVYDHTHRAGDAIRQVIRVTRRQGTLASVKVFLDDKLLTEKRV